VTCTPDVYTRPPCVCVYMALRTRGGRSPRNRSTARTVWTTDREKWAGWVESHVDNDPTLSVADVTDEYGITIDRYDEIVAANGDEI